MLFDQGTPVKIARTLYPRHSVRTTFQEGWSTSKNGDLLRVAEDAGFEVLVTTDNSLEYQQNLKGRKIAIVVLTRVQQRLSLIALEVDHAGPGTYARIDIPVR